MLPLAAVTPPEWTLFVIGLASIGGPPALIAWRRGRNAAGWSLLGILVACVAIAAFPKGVQSSPLVVIPALALTPTALFLLPKGARARKPKPADPQDWSSAAPLERSFGRDSAPENEERSDARSDDRRTPR